MSTLESSGYCPVLWESKNSADHLWQAKAKARNEIPNKGRRVEDQRLGAQRLEVFVL